MDPNHFCRPYSEQEGVQHPRFRYITGQQSYIHGFGPNSRPRDQSLNSEYASFSESRSQYGWNTNSETTYGTNTQYGWNTNSETTYGTNRFQNQISNRNMGQMPDTQFTRFTRNEQNEPTSLMYGYRNSTCNQQYTNRAAFTGQRHPDFYRDRRNEFQAHHQYNSGFSFTRCVTNRLPVHPKSGSADISVRHVSPVRNPRRYVRADTFRNETVLISPKRTNNSEPNSKQSPTSSRQKPPTVTGSPIPVIKHYFSREQNNTDRRNLKCVQLLSTGTTDENLKSEMKELNSSKITSEISNGNNEKCIMLKSDNETFLEEADDSDDKGVDCMDVNNSIISEKVNSESGDKSQEVKSQQCKETSSDRNINADKSASAEVLLLETKTEHLCIIETNQATENSQSINEVGGTENDNIMMEDKSAEDTCYNDEAFEVNTNCKMEAKGGTRDDYENVPRSDDRYHYAESNLEDNIQDIDNNIIISEDSASSTRPYCDQTSQINLDSGQDIKSGNVDVEPALDIDKPIGNVFCKTNAISTAPSEPSPGKSQFVTSKNKMKSKPDSCILQKDQNKSPLVFRKQNTISSPFLNIKTDGDKQLLKQHNIAGCYINLRSRDNIDAPDMNNTSPQTPGTSHMVKVETESSLPPERKSPVTFLSYDDSLIDEDDDSDDDILMAPAFIQSVNDIMNRPAPATPTRVLDISVGNSTPNSSLNMPRDCESPDLIPVKPCNKLTLDGLFQEHEEHADHVKEMDELNKELQNDLKQGGFVHILNREESLPEESFTDEQRNMLRQLEVQDTSIHHDWPGMVLFKPENYQCLFNNTLHPTHCGFTATSNGGRLERYMESLSVDQYRMVITSQMIPQLFMKITNQNQLLRWLFYMMSVHDDDDIQLGSQELLLDILHTQQIDGVPKWTPRLIDVLSVLVNYGASLESLLPCGPSDMDIIRGKLLQQPGYSQQPNVHRVTYRINNPMLVLKIITQSLHGQCGRYSPNDASLLIYALCKVILDPSTKTCPCSMEIVQNCITMVIHQYTESDWLKERLRLCRLLANLSANHHDHSHVAQLLPGGKRGAYLQRRYCYLATSQILTGNCDISDVKLDNFEIGYLEKFVNFIRDLLENDPYTLSSVIKLIELSVGTNYTLNTRQREQLKSLQEKVSRVRVKDCIGMLDRTRVKNMIVMVTSRWALDLQTVRRKQTKIFEYASSPVKIHIETLKPVQSSDDEESDNDDGIPRKIQKHSDAADNEDLLPCKIQKLSDAADNEDLLPCKIQKLSNTEVNFQTNVMCNVQRTDSDVKSRENVSCNVLLSDNGDETISQVLQTESKDEISDGISVETLSQTACSEVRYETGASLSQNIPVMNSSDVT